jgi:coenzyme PQQ precursor peptide PqqA
VVATPQIAGGNWAAGANQRRETMWHKPVMTEICVGAEINSYVSAARK